MKYCVALFLLLALRAPAQDLAPGPDGYTERPGFGLKKAIATGIAGTVLAGTATDFYFSWWKNTKKPFSFFTDHWLNGAQRGLDKFGHMFGAYVILKSVRNTLLWGGYDRSTALWIASGMAMFNAVEIEVGDGFSEFGFDYQDLTFDVIGVAYGMLQAEIPALDNFNVKFSYFSDKGFKTPASFIQDYDAMTVWLSVNVHNLLPEPVRKYWPEFINLAAGFGVTNGETRREFIIGIDFNLEGIHTSSEDVLYAQRLLNLMRIPAPAVVWTEGERITAHGIYAR